MNELAKGAFAGAITGAAAGSVASLTRMALENSEKKKEAKKKEAKALNGVQMLTQEYDALDLSGEFTANGLYGVPANASVLVYGNPKHGKSTFALQFANELARTNRGNVLYVANEEMLSNSMPSKSLQDRIKRIGYERNVFFSKDLSNIETYQFVIIDSINSLGIDLKAWEQLREKYPNTFFVLVSQATKEGNFRGSQEWAHSVDIMMSVKNGMVSTVGRFGSGEYKIKFE